MASNWFKRVMRWTAKRTAPKRSRRLLQVEALEDRVTPSTRIWDGGGRTNNWSDRFNWVGDAAPAQGDDLLFPANAPQKTNINDFSPGRNVGSILIQGTGYHLQGNQIDLRRSGTVITAGDAGSSNFIELPIFLGSPLSVESRVINVLQSGAQLQLSGVISSGSGASLTLAKEGSGTLVLSAANTYKASTQINRGVVVLRNDSALGDLTGTTVGPLATIQLEGGIRVSESFRLESGNLRSVSNNNVLLGQLNLNGTSIIVVEDPATLRVEGVVFDQTPGSGFRKQGTGLLELTRANSYSGPTRVEGGTLRVGNATALGQTQAGTTVLAGARLVLGGVTSAEPLTLDAEALGAAAKVEAERTSVLSGAIQLAGNAEVSAGANAFLEIRGTISGAGNLTVRSGPSSSVRFTAAVSNTYTGTTTVAAASSLVLDTPDGVNPIPGALVVSNGAVVDPRSRSLVLGAVTINSGTVTMGQSDLTVLGPLTLNGGLLLGEATLFLSGNVIATSTSSAGAATIDMGVVDLRFADRTFTVTDGPAAIDLRITSTAQGSLGLINGGLIKQGSGTLQLGTSNHYSGNTVVNAGTLLVDGAQPQSPVQVNAGATLGGVGTVGLLTVASGGTVSPGGAELGTLTVQSSAFFNPGSTLLSQLGSVGSAASDQLSVNGTVTLNGPTLTLNQFASAVGDTFQVLANDANEAIAGTFQGLAEGSTVSVSGVSTPGPQFRISYRGGTDGNDVVLTHINTPTQAENLRLRPAVIHEGQATVLTGNLTDPDAGDVLVLAVDWGDDSRVETFHPGTDPFRLTHSYRNSGSYTVHLQWRDDHGEGDDQDLTVTVAAAPGVESVVINDGSAQRSKVTRLTVIFSEVVTLAPGAFRLRKDGGGLVGLKVTSFVADGKTVAVLTFRGAGTAGSLADGNYMLTIFANKVYDGTGQALDGDDNGTAGGNHVERFFRLFGDSDGDRDVDQADRDRFFSTLGKRAGQDDFLAFFDFDGDGDVDAKDQRQFLRRLGTVLPA
jgi:autotransporter-associated beta strand protein